jgi:integrating conjugative element protein (TIGR03757 family)
MMISLVSMNMHAERIEVFTLSTHPVSLNGIQSRVCELDALNNMQQRLNKNLHLTVLLKKPDAHLSAQIASFYRCQEKACGYGLLHLPAIVIDETYVVYGMHAVDKALMATRQYKRVHHA